MPEPLKNKCKYFVDRPREGDLEEFLNGVAKVRRIFYFKFDDVKSAVEGLLKDINTKDLEADNLEDARYQSHQK